MFGGLLPALLQPGEAGAGQLSCEIPPESSLSPHLRPPYTRGGQEEAGIADRRGETRNLFLVMSPQITRPQNNPASGHMR